ncbi:MAG: OB-fold nucleic acid binding domain-containing protein [Actinomycetota bacterium]
MALLGRLIDRLSRPVEDLRAENCRQWVESIPNTSRIESVQPRERCRVAGVIQNIRIDPRQGSGSIEATISDGTGQMVAKWLGRSTLSGIKPGAGLVMEGTVGVDAEGDLVVLNPDYELVEGPEHS